MVAFAFVGWSNSGKTTLITALTRALVAARKRVATLKKAKHGLDLQPAGKDSTLMRAAGAVPVYLLGDTDLITIEPAGDPETLWTRLAARHADCDYFLLEGLRPSGVPLIEVIDSTADRGLKFPADQLSAVVGDRDPGYAVPFFSRRDMPGLARFMEAFHG